MKRYLSILLDFTAIALMVSAVAFVAWVLITNAIGCSAVADPVGPEIEWWQHESKWPDENYSAQQGLGAGDAVGTDLHEQGKAGYTP